jgi:hypothetical protein
MSQITVTPTFSVTKVTPGQVQGPRGATGPIGPVGYTGATGPQGLIGSTGLTGSTGVIGLTGSTGPQGLIGSTGPLHAINSGNKEILYLEGNSITGTGITYESVSDSLTINSELFLKQIAYQNIFQHLNLTTTPTVIDTFALNTYRSGKYIIQASYLTNFQISEFFVIHDGTNVFVMEYGLMHTSVSPIVSYSVNISAGDVQIIATAAAGSTTNLKVIKNLINT